MKEGGRFPNPEKRRKKTHPQDIAGQKSQFSYEIRMGPDPLLPVLDERAKKGPLSPPEEGLRRGVVSFPHNLLAQHLVQREYLSSLGLVPFGDDERERLHRLRFEKWQKEERETMVGSERGSTGGKKEIHAGSAFHELATLHIRAKIADLQHNWSGDTRTTIDTIISALPDELHPQTRDKVSPVYKYEPSPLELYLLSKVQTLPAVANDNKEGALRVMESIYGLRDKVRTKKFLQGVKEAVANLDSSGKETITMCDAGTGALPILSIYAALCSDKVKCTALELNPNSAKIAQEVVNSLGLQDQITIMQADATKFIPQEPLDFLVSETMHAGFTQEPMVQILSHLQPYVKSDGITLPSGVSIKAALIPFAQFSNSTETIQLVDYRHIVVRPPWKNIVDYTPGDQLDEIKFSLPFPKESIANQHLVAVTSEVRIGSQTLYPYQSLLSNPQYVRDAKGELNCFKQVSPDRAITIKYKPGALLRDVATLE